VNSENELAQQNLKIEYCDNSGLFPTKLKCL
jgi:hypothetical protein